MVTSLIHDSEVQIPNFRPKNGCRFVYKIGLCIDQSAWTAKSTSDPSIVHAYSRILRHEFIMTLLVHLSEDIVSLDFTSYNPIFS